MSRNKTAIFFIFLAYVLLLAHSVVPHHHHHEVVCIAGSHCPFDNGDEHHGTNNDDYCMAKKMYVVPANHVNPSCKYLILGDIHSQNGILSAILQARIQIPSINMAAEVLPWYLPLKITSQSILLPSGLRAPPLS